MPLRGAMLLAQCNDSSTGSAAYGVKFNYQNPNFNDNNEIYT